MRSAGRLPLRPVLPALGRAHTLRPDAKHHLLTEALPMLSARPGFEVRSSERPATPDSLPVIERVSGHSSIFVSTGHGHLGLTLAAVSSRILADLVTDGSSIYSRELRSQRFRRSTKRQAVVQAA
jgi:glycine/D-amino acid oxidase-like deaminating enzyme